MSGLDIQKHFQSYDFVWLVPASALLALFLSLGGYGGSALRRLAGAVPFGILAFSLNRFGRDFWQMIAVGGWLALAAGAVLVILPGSKPQPKA